MAAQTPLPTMYVQDESTGGGNCRRCNLCSASKKVTPKKNDNNLRFRNRSTESSLQGFYLASPDSGIESPGSTVTSPEYFTPPDRSSSLHFTRHTPEEEVDSDKSPLCALSDYLERRSRRRAALFSNDSTSRSFGLLHLLPVLVVIVVLASSIFTVVTLNRGLDRGTGDVSVDNLNAKYLSIDYGHRRRREVLQAEGKPLPEELFPGGKRAAMKFAHETAKRKRVVDSGARLAVPEQRLRLREKILELASKERVDSGQGSKKGRKMLLDKISQFRNFATTKVRPETNKREEEKQEQQQEVATDLKTEVAIADPPKKKKKAKRASNEQPMSSIDLNNPFRITSFDAGSNTPLVDEEGDPSFRIGSN